MANLHWLTIVTFFPLLSVAALLVLRSEDHIWIRRIALISSLVEFVFSLGLLRYFDSANAEYQFVEYHNWIGETIHYHLGIDGISLFLVLLTTFLTPISILCSRIIPRTSAGRGSARSATSVLPTQSRLSSP